MIPLLLAGLAHAGEYRRLDLADGRILTVEVLGTEPTGLIVRTPQGTRHLPYEQVVTITPAEFATFEALPPLRVLLLPFTAAEPATADDAGRIQGMVWHAFGAVPHTELFTIGQMAGYAPTSTADALSACGADLPCLRARIAPYDVDLVVSGTVSGAARGDLAIVAAWTQFPEAGATGSAVLAGAPDAQKGAAEKVVHDLLGVELPTPVAVAVAPEPAIPTPTEPGPVADTLPVTPPTPRRPRPHTVSPALAAVPLPGFTAFAGGDVGHGLVATAIAVPATVGVVYAAGASSSRPEEVVGLSVLSWWALCAFTNVAWMPTVAPTEGGASVQISGSF